MNLPELSIRRHVLAWMLSGVLVLFGLLALVRMGIDRFPQVDIPLVSITTVLRGASPEIVDASVTAELEDAVHGIPGLRHMNAFSAPGVSVITLEFELEKDLDEAFNEVQARVNQVLPLLPEGVESPVVEKIQVGAAPMMWLALTGDRTLQQLNQYARNVLRPAWRPSLV